MPNRGTEQSRFYAYGKSRGAKRLRQRRRRKIFFIAIAAIFACGSIVVCVSFLSRLPALTIGAVDVAGAKILSADAVGKSVSLVLDGNYFGLFSRRNIFIYPKKQLRRDLENEYPAIVEASIKLKSENALSVAITERLPKAIYCPTSVSETATTSPSSISENVCYYLDDKGLIFARSAVFSEGVYLAYRGFEQGTTTIISRQLLPEKEFEAISRFADSLRKYGLDPVSVVYVDDYIEITIQDKARIFIPGKKTDYSLILSNFEAALRQADISSALSGKSSPLDYIDLRSNDKIYYKFKE